MVSRRLAEILAQMVEAAIESDQLWIRWAIETDEIPVQKCSCRARVGEEQCVCRVEVALPRAYMIRAARRLERNQFVGMPPRQRRCLLCLRGDHDLDATYKLRVVLGDQVLNEAHVPGPTRRRTKQSDRVRAERAGAYVAGTHAMQLAAARDREGIPGAHDSLGGRRPPGRKARYTTVVQPPDSV
jgi:hypothetical protein